MTHNPDDNPLADEVPSPTPQKRHSVDAHTEGGGLDPGQVADLLHRDANPADLID
jgi:hypothetical protein